ncbi:pikromycin synthase [Streptomyces sp. PsTaAH-130]|nr:pikromycin synthase [Streptomyces sp. PsTaAH-130]
MASHVGDRNYPPIFGDDFARDPYRPLAALRARAPAHKVLTPDGTGLWITTGYQDTRAVLDDPTMGKDADGLRAALKRPGTVHEIDRMIAFTDPPEHTRLRRLVVRAFTTARVAALRPRIESVAERLVHRMRRADGPADLIADFAVPLPFTVICELLGVPDEDRPGFRAAWSRLRAAASGTTAYTAAADGMAEVLFRIVRAKRGGGTDDLLAALVNAPGDGERLTETELVAMAYALLVAGHETTANLIGNGMFCLLTHPQQYDLIRTDAGLVPGAVHELLRYESPVYLATHRFTTVPVQLGHVTVPAGEVVLAGLGPANRDPRRFPDPDRLDITRPSGGHLSFGHGIHRCLGAPLALLEAEVALTVLPALRLAVPADRLDWHTTTVFRGLNHLPVTLAT